MYKENAHICSVHSLPVESKEDKISLVVEGRDLSTDKVRVLREEGSEQPGDGVSQTGGKVIEDHFRRVFGWIFTSPLWRDTG